MPERPDRTVEVVAHSDRWSALFSQERAALAEALGSTASSIEHIGSTAVQGLVAKPTIDILVVVGDMSELLDRVPAMEALGYQHRPDNTLAGSGEHQFFRRVSGGKRTHHVHVMLAGAPQAEQYRRFRDVLRSDAVLAARYAEVKLRLASQHADDRAAYVQQKSDWVDETLRALGI